MDIQTERKPRTKHRPLLVLTIGLPGSGKSTAAKRIVARFPGKVARVNRDDLRAMLRGELVWGDRDLEDQATLAQRAAIAALLRAGVHVIVDDTNLISEHRQELRQLARQCGARFRIIDRFLRVPVSVCIVRDAARTARVGQDVIHMMAEQAQEYLRQKQQQGQAVFFPSGVDRSTVVM